MQIPAIKNISHNSHIQPKKTKNNFNNFVFGNNEKKYSKTEGLAKGFLAGFLSFWGSLALLLAVVIISRRNIKNLPNSILHK